MRVFVSSTCYDLLDLRAELYRDLRDLGVEACFSDLKESDFETSGQPGQNSIETCLGNLLASDVVIVILSQRYGPPLKNYENLSATHVEYNAAVKASKKIHFYVRDRLFGDWSGWKKHKKPMSYPSSWAAQGEDASGLFTLIDAHQKLTGGGDTPGPNNWFWPFTSSVDLREDIRKRIGEKAYLDTGKRMAERGQAPVIVVVGQGTDDLSDPHTGLRTGFKLNIANGGTVPAIGLSGKIVIEGVGEYSAEGAKLGLVVPGDDPNSRLARTVQIEIPRGAFDDALSRLPAGRSELPIWFVAGYYTHSGHMMEDHTLLTVHKVMVSETHGRIQFCASPAYYKKRVTGMNPLVE